MTVDRTRFRHRIEHLLYRAVESVLGRIDMETCVSIGRGLGTFLHAISGKYRRLVARNLRIATAPAPLSPADLENLVRETFRRGGANFLASLKTQIMPVADLAKQIDPEGLRLLGRNRLEGRGTVVAMAHMGNWEALTRLGALVLETGTYGGVYRPLDNPLMDELTRSRRTSTGAMLFSRKDGYYSPSSFLREGGALAVLGDQRAGARGTAMPFLGKITTCPPLLEMMAKRGRARIVTLEMRTTGPGQWLLALHPLREKADTAEIMAALESILRSSLPDVFWFHDRWTTNAQYPLSLFTKLDPEMAATATVPLRLVLTTPPQTPEDSVQAFLSRMFEIRPDLRIERLTCPGARSTNPAVILHDWDSEAPEMFAEALIKQVDADFPTPIDGFLLFGAEVSLAKAARRMGHKVILGFDVKGKPWSRSLPLPGSLDEWARLPDDMNFMPKRHQS